MKTLVILSQYRVVPQSPQATTPCQGCAFDRGDDCPNANCTGVIFELIEQDEEVLEDV